MVTIISHVTPTKSAHLAIFSICVVFTLLALVIQVQNEVTDSSVCKDVRCNLPPKAYNCNETKTDHPLIVQRLGPLKDCCPVYYCLNGTDDSFLFVGAHEKRKKKEPVCTNISCPQNPEDSQNSCVVQANPDAVVTEFAEDDISCCPVWYCTSADGDVTTTFSAVEGTLPPIGQLENDGKHCGEEITCATKPKIKDTVCTVQQKEFSLVIASAVGILKDCCPIWECIHPDGSVYDHFWIQGHDFRFKEIRRKQGNTNAAGVGDKRGKDTNPIAPTTDAGKSPSAPDVTKDPPKPMKCESGESCPKLKKESCSYETSKKPDRFVPTAERCCPLMYCNETNGLHRTHYVKFSGSIPTSQSEIDNEKGKASGSKKCPKITCGEKPKMPKAKSCTSQSIGQGFLPKIKPFLSCCQVLNCTQQDGSHSIELSITASSFSYFEMSFYNVPEYDDEDDGSGSRKGQRKSSSKQSNLLNQNGVFADNKWMTVGEFVPQAMATAQAMVSGSSASASSSSLLSRNPFLPSF